MDPQILQTIAIWAIPVLFAITIHEVAHGWVANKLGDKTALMLGRITLNPVKHIDPIGTIIVPLLFVIMHSPFLFGWAKPVPVNFRNLRRPRRDMALVAAAGPASNLIMALIWVSIMKLGIYLIQNKISDNTLLIEMAKAGILVNLVLAVLNLIPIPPLDGSRVVSSILPPKVDFIYSKLEPFGFLLLIALLLSGVLGLMIGPPIEFLFKNILELFRII